MGECRDCRWWKSPGAFAQRYNSGLCRLTQCSADGRFRYGGDKTKAAAVSRKGASAPLWLATEPTFGCNQFAPKDAE